MPSSNEAGGAPADRASPERLELLLAEAAAARCARNLEALADALGAMDGGGETAARLAGRARSMLTIEGIVGGRFGDLVEVGGLLDRMATLILMAFPSVGGVRTSFARREVPEPVARAVLASVHEIAHVAGSAAPTGVGIDLFISSEVEDDRLVVAVAAVGPEPMPVAADANALAFERARRLAGLFGGEVVEGWRDGAMLMGVAMDVGRAAGR